MRILSLLAGKLQNEYRKISVCVVQAPYILFAFCFFCTKNICFKLPLTRVPKYQEIKVISLRFRRLGLSSESRDAVLKNAPHLF